MSPALKLADFGASAVLAQNGDNLLQFHRPQKQALLQDVTTFRYAAPEVLRHRNYNFSADVWGVGVIGWEMLQEDPREAAIAIEDNHRCDERVKAVEAFQKQVEANAEQAKRIPLFHLVWSMVQEDSKRPSASNTLDFAVFAATAKGSSALPAKKASALAAGEAAKPKTPLSPPSPALATSPTLGEAAKPASAPCMSQGAQSSDLPKRALDVVIALRDLMPHLLPGDVSAFNEVPANLAPACCLLVLQRALAHLGEVEPDLNQTSTRPEPDLNST
jgi:serine/threonine protein kinase